PCGQGGVRQEARAERSGVQDADALLPEVGDGLVGEAGVRKRVLGVTESAVDVGRVADEAEDLLRITAEAEAGDLALVARGAEGGEGVIDGTVHRHELDVVTEDDGEVMGTAAVQPDVVAIDGAAGAEVELGEVVPAELRAENVGIARDVAERD